MVDDMGNKADLATPSLNLLYKITTKHYNRTKVNKIRKIQC